MIEYETTGRPDRLITLPRRGLQIIPPQETADNMARIQRGERIIPWSEREKARLALLKKDPIMKKRYRDPEMGQSLMEQVSYERRDELLGIADELKDQIVESWNEISPEKNIAVVLFGSVARGLVRNTSSEDPSNIDMAVIGNISPEERSELLDAIRSARKDVQSRILATCDPRESYSENSGNAGVYVQHQDKLIINKFATAKEYISSNAIVLHDPVGIWSSIEEAALDHETVVIVEKKAKQRERKHPQRQERVVYSSA